jgi:dTDP-4-dehydrorhamnose 3,5-epimerase
MKFNRLEIPDLILCEPKVFGDDRGYFSETFRQDELDNFLGHSLKFCQDNESKSTFGVLRGLHYQLPPYAQTKLVRVLEGSVLDVALDIRKGSPSFGKHLAIELSSNNKRQLLIPRGFAHGFVVLSDKAIFSYKVDNYYNPESDRGIAFDDKKINIDWKIGRDKLQLSSKDLQQPLFESAEHFKYKKDLYV